MMRKSKVKQGQTRPRPADTLDYIHQKLLKIDRFDELLAQAGQARDADDHDGLFQAAECLVESFPDRPESLLALAAASAGQGFIALFVHSLRTALQRWPGHPLAASNRKILAAAEQAMDIASNPTPLEVGAQHEWMQWQLRMGQPAKARDLALEVLKTRPHDLPSLNNLSTAYLHLGQWEEAIQAAERVLQLCPDNVHALANLIVFHVRLGRSSQVAPWVLRLKASGHGSSHRWTKVGEALSYLGDDPGVIAAHRRAPKGGDALLKHYAAVAWARQGDWRRAQGLWKKAAAEGLEVAQDNLSNARLSQAQRHSPWAFGLQNWLDGTKLSEVLAEPNPERALLKKMPELEALLPILLDRGDPVASKFCVDLARSLRHPALMESLRDFALSQRGTDGLRLSAAQACKEAGLLMAETPPSLPCQEAPLQGTLFP